MQAGAPGAAKPLEQALPAEFSPGWEHSSSLGQLQSTDAAGAGSVSISSRLCEHKHGLEMADEPLWMQAQPAHSAGHSLASAQENKN